LYFNLSQVIKNVLSSKRGLAEVVPNHPVVVQPRTGILELAIYRLLKVANDMTKETLFSKITDDKSSDVELG